MTTTENSAAQLRPEDPYSRRWAGLAVLCLSLLIVVMANTALIVAAPSMLRELSLTSTDLQWIIDGYTVPYAALMLLCGVLGDRFGRRRALLAGLGVFAAGAVYGSLADSAVEVIAARIVMGVGAAVIMPATLSLLVAMFPAHERARAIAAWAATSGLAIALGPLLAGWLLESHAWGSTFLINVPIAAFAAVTALVLVPASKAEHVTRTDWLGGLLSVIAVGGLVFAIIDRMLGGKGEFSGKVRELTDIERTVVERVIMRMLELLEESWSTVVDVRFRYENLESNPFFVQICPGTDMVLLVILKLKVGDVEGMVSICIPYFLMEPIMDKLSSQQWFASTGRKSDEGSRDFILKHMQNVRVPLALELGHTVLNVADVMQLRAGDVIKLDETLKDPLSVRIGNLVKFRAVPGSVNGRYAAEISEIIPGEDDLPEREGGAVND